MSQQTKRTFNVLHKLTCKTQYVIYLMECILCKIQYIGKSKTHFDLRLNNHNKDVIDVKAISACNHFKIHAHNFMKGHRNCCVCNVTLFIKSVYHHYSVDFLGKVRVF